MTKFFDPAIWSDLYKDAYGTRPRFSLRDKTPQELDMLWHETCLALENTIRVNRDNEAHARVAFYDRLDGMVQNFNLTRKTALRWMLQADGVQPEEIEMYGYEAACYEYGLSYSMAKELEDIAT